MNEDEKEVFLLRLDDEMLKGGVILSEWSSFLIRDADTSFISGAYLSALLTALAAIESHLKFEESTASKLRLVELIDNAALAGDLRADLHKLRRYRNKWVHIDDPFEDQELLTNPEKNEAEIEQMATLALRTMRRVIYSNQCV